MVVKHISLDELNNIINTMNETGIKGISIILTEDEIKSTSKDTWKFIKNELTSLKDMTFTCSSYQYCCESVKKFTFTCFDRSQLIRVANFINEIICNRNFISIIDTSDIFKGGLPDNPRGANARCPLF
ncbi:hypothetical protein GQ473_03065 [archaeon]|nr:hypothetical protein [archaeon]